MSKKDEVARAFSEDGAKKTSIGGQALIEGVMMRGMTCWSAAVRKPDGGVHLETHDLQTKRKGSWMGWPFVRGCVALVDSMALGFKALEVAANNAYDSEGETFESLSQQGRVPAVAKEDSVAPDSSEQNTEHTHGTDPAQGTSDSSKQDMAHERVLDNASSSLSDASVPANHLEGARVGAERVGDQDSVNKQDLNVASADKGESFFGKAEMAISMTLGVVLALVLFMLLPAALSNLIVGDYDTNTFAWNMVDGVARVAIFVFYVWLIGRMKDIKRMFAYHGAEHKAIHCYEHGLELTPKNAAQFPCLHVRCGTAFLIMVMIIAILIYTLLPLDKVILAWGITNGVLKFIVVLLLRIALLPLIAGVSYEITVKWAGSHPDNPFVKIVLWPGMQMQRLTTNEPDEGMLECSLAAMKAVLARESS